MPASPNLRTTQRWMQAAIMSPGSNEEAIHSSAAAIEIPPEQAQTELLPSRSLTALERLGIYRGMYELRLRGALEVDYPLLSGCLGEELWRELVELYLEAHPSRSYTLNRLGDRLPGFIPEVEGLPRPAFLADLARYELALTQVFDAAECRPLTTDELLAVPPESWESARLKPIEAFRLESYRYPVNAYAEAVRKEGGSPRPPRRKDTHLVIFRRDYKPLALTLTKSAFRLLGGLANGKTLGEALQAARAPRNALHDWFRQWVSEGLFQKVEIAR